MKCQDFCEPDLKVNNDFPMRLSLMRGPGGHESETPLWHGRPDGVAQRVFKQPEVSEWRGWNLRIVGKLEAFCVKNATSSRLSVAVVLLLCAVVLGLSKAGREVK